MSRWYAQVAIFMPSFKAVTDCMVSIHTVIGSRDKFTESMLNQFACLDTAPAVYPDIRLFVQVCTLALLLLAHTQAVHSRVGPREGMEGPQALLHLATLPVCHCVHGLLAVPRCSYTSHCARLALYEHRHV